MVFVVVIKETVASITKKIVVDDKGVECGSMVRLRMKERYIKRSGFDADEEL